MITQILLIFFFIIICITITNAFNNIENFDTNNETNNEISKKDKIILQDGPINYIIADEAKIKFPMNVNITYSVEKKNPNCNTLETQNLYTVSNNIITTGYGSMTTLSSAPYKPSSIIDMEKPVQRLE